MGKVYFKIMEAKSLDQKISEFLQKGGKIQVLPPVNEPLYISHRTPWHMGGINNNKKSLRTKRYHASAPAGRIEPRRPGKPWPNYKKTGDA